MNKVLTNPSADDIRQGVAEFDAEDELLETALQILFRQYPENTQPAQVLLKATTLNELYATQIPVYHASIPDLLDVAKNIATLSGIDAELMRGDKGAVARIATTKFPHKKDYFYYSFATKYSSWHNPASYPIFDSRVRIYLTYLRDHGCLNRFKTDALWDYPAFKRIVEEFQTKNGLRDFSFKELDKFMYLQGGKLMERGVNNYPTPENGESDGPR